jgi:hypothetical protein
MFHIGSGYAGLGIRRISLTAKPSGLSEMISKASNSSFMEPAFSKRTEPIRQEFSG